MAKILELQLQHQSSSEYSGLISFRIDWLELFAALCHMSHSSRAAVGITRLLPPVAALLRFAKACCCSVSESRPTLCDPMDCRVPGFPIFHSVPEIAQTHVHWVDDAIQPSHRLFSPSPAFHFSQHQGLFQ